MTLDDFLQTLANNKELEQKKITSYQDYLSETMLAPSALYGDTVKEAMDTYLRNKPAYGETGESLSQNNLLNSGYAAHLAERREAEKEASLAAAEQEYTEALQAVPTTYAAYLDKNTVSDNEKIGAVAKYLVKLDDIDYDNAFDYAITQGLDREKADLVAQAVEDIRGNTREKNTLDKIISYGLNYENSLKYAKACGFSDEEATTIAKTARDILDQYELIINSQK